jgi:hypothetical protein
MKLEQEGGDLVSTLINLSIPFGLVLARESVPDVSQALKRLTKKGGRGRRRRSRSRKRKRRTALRNKKRKTIRGHRGGKARKGPLARQVGGARSELSALYLKPPSPSSQEQIDEVSRLFKQAGGDLKSEDKKDLLNTWGWYDVRYLINIMTEAARNDFKDAEGVKIPVSVFLKDARLRMQLAREKLMAGLTRHAAKRGGKRRTKRRRTKKRKQRGGFMRATTRNFCQMKKL